MSDKPLDGRFREVRKLQLELKRLKANKTSYLADYKAQVAKTEGRIEELWGEIDQTNLAEQQHLLYTIHQGDRLIGHGRNAKK